MAHYARTMQTALNVPHPSEIFLTSEPTAVSTVTIEAINIQKNNIIVHFNLFPLLSEKEINKPGLYHFNNLNNNELQCSLEQALKQFPEHDLLILFSSPVGNKQVKEDVVQVKEVRFIKELVAGNVAAKTELNIEVVGRNEQPVTREGTTSDRVLLNYHLTNKIQQLFQPFAIFMEGLNSSSQCSQQGSSPPLSKEVASHQNHNTTQKSNTYDSNAFEHGSSVLLAAAKSTTTGNVQSLSTKTYWTKDITTNEDEIDDVTDNINDISTYNVILPKSNNDVNNSEYEVDNNIYEDQDDHAGKDHDEQDIQDDHDNEDVVVERSSSSRLSPTTPTTTNPKTKSKPKNERGRGRDTRRRLFATLNYATIFSLCVLTVVAFFVSILKNVKRLLIVRSSEYIFILYSHIC